MPEGWFGVPLAAWGFQVLGGGTNWEVQSSIRSSQWESSLAISLGTQGSKGHSRMRQTLRTIVCTGSKSHTGKIPDRVGRIACIVLVRCFSLLSQVEEGDLYICTTSLEYNGHLFIPEVPPPHYNDNNFKIRPPQSADKQADNLETNTCIHAPCLASSHEFRGCIFHMHNSLKP